MPLFSVVIPLYNKRDTVARALNSVLAQAVQDFEVVVVNDGSTDGGETVVAGFADPRIRLIHQANQGVSAARNRGIAEARADLIAFLDADDEWLPLHLDGIQALLGSFPSCDVFATSYEYVHPDGQARLPEYHGLAVAPGSSGIIGNYFDVAAASDPPLWTSAVVARKTALDRHGGFPAGVAVGEDLLTWARLAATGAVAFLNMPLARYHFPVSFDDRSERNARAVASGDEVLDGLTRLAGTAKPAVRESLLRYIGRVAEVAAVMEMGSGNYGAARRHARFAWRHGKRSAKIIAVLACSLVQVGNLGQRFWAWMFVCRGMLRRPAG